MSFIINQNKDTASVLQKLITNSIRKGIEDTSYSLGMLRKAVRQAESSTNNSLKAEAFYATGDIFFKLRIYNRAFANFMFASRIYFNSGQHRELAYTQLALAESQYYRGNYADAASHFTSAIKTSQQYGIPEITDEANEYLGLIYGVFQNLSGNTKAYIKSLEIKQTLNDEKGIIRVAGNLAEIFYQSEKYDSALIYSNISFAKARKLNLLTDMYMARCTKIASLIRLNKLKAAYSELKFFSEDKIPLQDANLNIHYQTLLGNYFLAKNDEIRAMFHYDSAFSVIHHHSFPELLIILYSNMAASYLQKGDLKKAYDSYKKFNHQLSIFYSGNNLTNLANLKGLVFLDASKDEIQHLNNENDLKALLLSQEREARKNLAVQNLLKDSILRKEESLNEALAKENNFKQEKLIGEKSLSSAVSRQNQLQNEKLKSEKQLRFYLISSLGLFVGLGALIFLMYKRQRKKSAIIQKQSDDLKTLMREIHHRVKNNLQVISSLLDLQSLSIKDKQASGAVKEGKFRVQAMAFIHQNLYDDGIIKGIVMEDYINNLVENLFNSYNIQKDKISLVTDIDHLNLDVDTVIPLGLIMNELINNSLKYAFKDKEAGKIYVALKEHEKRLELHVNDDGCGFPPTWNNSENGSFGYKLIHAFAKKLKAQIEIYNDEGACVSMYITRYKMAQ